MNTIVASIDFSDLQLNSFQVKLNFAQLRLFVN